MSSVEGSIDYSVYKNFKTLHNNIHLIDQILKIYEADIYGVPGRKTLTVL